MLLAGTLGALTHAAAELLPIQAYGRQDGVPHDRVKRIRQDRLGYVWLCTTEGLARFDGRSFTTYGVQDGLPVPSTNDLLETSGGFWVATNGGGIAFFDTETTGRRRFLPVPVGEDAAARVNVLLLDRAGTLWAGTDGGLFRMPLAAPTGRRFEVVPLEIPERVDASMQVWGLLETPHGLVAATHHGLVELGEGRPPRWVPVVPGPNDHVWDLARGPGGEVLAGHETAGLVVLDPVSLAVVRRVPVGPGPSQPAVVAVVASGDRLFLGTGRGLCTLDGETVSCYSKANGLTDDLVRTVGTDRDGGIWIGTEGAGAMRLAPAGAVVYGEADGLGRIVSSVFTRANGELWVSSSSWLLSRFDGRAFTSVRPRLPAALDSPGRWRAYHGVLEDREHGLWVAMSGGLVRFGPVRTIDELARTPPRRVYGTADGLASEHPSRLFEDSRGDLWIGCFGPVTDPLTRWVRSSDTLERYGAAAGLPGFASPTAFAEDRSGSVWIAYRGGELARSRGGRFELMNGRNGFPDRIQPNLLVDSAGHLWAGTHGKGLVRVERPESETPEATIQPGVEGFYVSPLVEDGDGRIVVGTSKGLVRLDPRTGVHSAVSVAPLDVTRAVLARTGEIWLASYHGLGRLPRAEPEPAGSPSVRIQAIEVSGVARPLGSLGVESASLGDLLPATRLEVSFAALGLIGQKLRYDHRLEGLDGGWSTPHADPVVRYDHLPSGRYRLELRAVAPDGGCSAPATVSFRVLPPLYLRWWFLLALAAVLAGAGYGVKAASDHRQHQLDGVRAQIASDLHDDLGASLSRISILAEVARRRVREGSGGEEMLEKLGGASRGVLESLGDGIWAVDPKRDDLGSLATRLELVASELLEPLGVAWRVTVPEGAERVRLHPGRRRQIYLVLKEAITNAARHSGAGEVTLTCTASHARLTFELRDDGQGLPAEAAGERGLSGGRGLPNMRRRAEELGAQLALESAPGRGTTVRLVVPTSRGA